MTVAEQKRKWFDLRRAELHARGLKDAHIAEQMGYKPAYFSQVANGENIGDGFIDKMCSAFGFRFTLDVPVAEKAKDDPLQGERMARLTRAVEEQGTLIRTLTELVISRLPKG